ncbi:hypothetical protein [Lactiplantibacillus pentosus]|nr:hypothetical protein [Lactiplantibacillus pentosus]BBM22852.1 uncharacterized protein SN13T_2900 [Lactiplantibacillus plantarum]
MVKNYSIKAEQFDGSPEMAAKYDLDYEIERSCRIVFYSGEIEELFAGDWIITRADGLHQAMTNKEFKRMYTTLPAIPKEVADWIETTRAID